MRQLKDILKVRLIFSEFCLTFCVRNSDRFPLQEKLLGRGCTETSFMHVQFFPWCLLALCSWGLTVNLISPRLLCSLSSAENSFERYMEPARSICQAFDWDTNISWNRESESAVTDVCWWKQATWPLGDSCYLSSNYWHVLSFFKIILSSTCPLLCWYLLLSEAWCAQLKQMGSPFLTFLQPEHVLRGWLFPSSQWGTGQRDFCAWWMHCVSAGSMFNRPSPLTLSGF